MKLPTLSPFKNSKSVLYLVNHKTTSLIILSLIVGGSYYFYTKKTAPVNTDTYSLVKVRLGGISTDINGSGQIVPINTLDLKTKTNGDISQVLVKAGDKVKQGQALVRLNASQALQKVRTAEVNLESAKLDLEKLQKPPETLDITLIKNTIAKDNSDIKNQDTLVANAYKNLLNATPEAVSAGLNSTDVAPTISGSYLGTTEGQIAISIYGAGDGSVYNLSGLTTGTGYVNSVVSQPLGDTGLYIKFAPNTTQTNWTVTLPSKKAANYLTLKTTYQNALDTKDRAVADLQRGIVENNLKLDKLMKGADTLDIQARQLVIKQRENDLTQARSDYADSIVTAPFDGTVATLNADIGTTVTSGVSLGSIITDKQVAKISLNEVDVAKLSLGQTAKLSFDAVDGLIASSSVAEIDTLGTASQGVVTYTVKLLFALSDPRVKPGMSVTADIVSNNKEGVLLVPLSAIMQDKVGTFVEVATEKNLSLSSSTRKLATKPVFEKRIVTTGISNDRFTEIVSGVSQGDIVIITKKGIVSKTVSAPSGAQLLGGGGARRAGF